MVTHQLQVERRTGKVRRPETDVLPLCHATNWHRYGTKLRGHCRRMCLCRDVRWLSVERVTARRRRATSRATRSPVSVSVLPAHRACTATTARRSTTTGTAHAAARYSADRSTCRCRLASRVVIAKFHYTDTDTDPNGPNGVSPCPCPCSGI